MIRQATPRDLPAAAALAARLWPGHTPADMERDLAGLMHAGAAVFLFFDGDTPAGFAQCQLRRDYVEGTQTSPVGYLEGIYVLEPYRGRGHARALLAACEQWAKDQGCSEFASDCELDNTDSLRFHLRAGFAEANRIICFTKPLQPRD